MSGGYYLRQLFFGLLIALALHGLSTRLPLFSPALGPTGWLLVSVVNTLLYPYARLLYEGLWAFILGDQVYYFGGLLLLIVLVFRLVMMLFCWAYALPLALLFGLGRGLVGLFSR